MAPQLGVMNGCVIHADLQSATTLAVDATSVYWTSPNQGKVFRATPK